MSGFLSLAILIVLIYGMWGTVALSGVCGMIRKLNKGDLDFLPEVDASDLTRNFVEDCFL